MAETNLALVIVGLALAFILAVYAVARRYKKVGPNMVMVISGRKYRIKTPDGRVDEVGFRIRRGGGAFILPLIEKVDLLSLEIITLDITTPEVYTKPGVPIIVDPVAQVKVGGDERSIRTSAEQFLGKSGITIRQLFKIITDKFRISKTTNCLKCCFTSALPYANHQDIGLSPPGS